MDDEHRDNPCWFIQFSECEIPIEVTLVFCIQTEVRLDPLCGGISDIRLRQSACQRLAITAPESANLTLSIRSYGPVFIIHGMDII
ncbi:hypothetical protein [Photobacterium sp. 53610]|uniref:hypothetical protein n=1 Tax=Photobacterium sp. 53610 TaxID=3102789 RepID=UPI002EDB798D